MAAIPPDRTASDASPSIQQPSWAMPEALHGEPNALAGPLLWEGVSMEEAARTFKRELILARLERHGSVKAARESLGLTKTTFHRYMKTLGIPTRED